MCQVKRLSEFLVVIIAIVYCGCPAASADGRNSQSSGYEVIELSEPPDVLEPEITFLAEAPVIDGILDPGLQNLPVRSFSQIVKVPAENQLIPVSYRLAYGTSFFYVYVEAEADELTFRDRAYQNGDGFHMVLALPRPDNEPTDEFYVVACSAVDKARMEWSRRIFWYYNVTNLFLRSSEETKLEFVAADGKIGFELILPWKDVHPYHPWISESLGFNLCFVKAVGEQGKNYQFVIPDMKMQSENSKRMYCLLKFQEPELDEDTQTFVLLDRNHIGEGETLRATAVTVSGSPANENLVLRIVSGEGARVGQSYARYECSKGITRNEFVVDTAATLPAGGYSVEWSSRNYDSKGDSGLTVLPEFDPVSLNADIEGLADVVAPSSFTTYQFLAEEIHKQLSEVKPYETCASQRIKLAKLLKDINAAKGGEDIYANKTGLVRKAFRSKLDDTLQPYCVRIPEDFDPAKKYPLMVFLHGSASDETNIAGFDYISEGSFIELAPRARGTSNVYSADNAQEDVAEAIDAVVAGYPIDTDRIFLSGFSMGGYGVYRTFYETPEKFRALVVLSGHPNLANRWLGGEHPNFLEEKNLDSFKDIPIFIFHGMQDRNCPFEITEQLIEKLRNAGAQVEFRTEEDKGHERMGAETIEKYHEWLGKILSEVD